MQGSGQQALMPGTVGTPYNVLFSTQAGQMAGVQQAILAPRLALVAGGARPGAPLAGAAAAAGAQHRPAAVHLPGMGMLLKAPQRKTGGTQQKGRKHCNCKNSRCLKLYCECFASGRYCDNCNCVSCFNNKESESVRQSAVEAILERNPNAFRPKIQTAEGDTHPISIRNAPDGTVRHTKGCNCKKSSCLKKYCECFQGGIFCTEICKCVDCKNYDGSEARAQVLSVHDTFNVQQLHQAAQQHALKRQRVMQGVPQLAGTAGLIQAQNALQQLAAAAAAGGSNAPSMPLQQLQALQAAAAAASAPQQPPASPQPASRPALLDVVHDLVKPAMIEELCQLLILVAKEEADKQQHLQDQQQQEQQQDASKQTAAAAAEVVAGAHRALANGIQQQDAAGLAAAASAQQGVPAVKCEQDADGNVEMQTADLLPEQQKQEEQELSLPKPAAAGDLSDSYAAQEGVVLQEFNAILQRIITQAEKKANTGSSTAGAAAPAASQAATAAAAGAGSGQEPTASPTSGMADADQQLLLQQQQQQQAQHVAQQQAPAGQPQPVRPTVLSLPQQQALAQQQAIMLQAASNNYALAQLQQRAMLAGGTGQQLATFPAGGLGVQLPGLRPMGMGMQQMVQVLAADGSVRHISANALMSLLPGGAQQAATFAAPTAAAMSAPLAGTVSAAPAAAGAPAASAAAPAGVGVSLLSLLNGAISSSNGTAAGAGGS